MPQHTSTQRCVILWSPKICNWEWVIDSLLSVRAPSVCSVLKYEHMQTCVCVNHVCVCVNTYSVCNECEEGAYSHGYRSLYSDLLNDSNGITEWDRNQLWCKLRWLFTSCIPSTGGEDSSLLLLFYLQCLMCCHIIGSVMYSLQW